MFENSQHVKTLIKNVNEKLGFSINQNRDSNKRADDESLLFTDVQLIYDICRFEAAWHPQNISYWCAAFNEDDLKVQNLFIQ
jgi:hypothetical protein